MQLEKALHVLLEVASKQSNLLGGENKGAKTREKDWDPIQAFYPDSCGRVATMTTGKPSWKNRKYGSSVCREAGQDAGAVTVDTPHNTNVLRGFRERDEVSMNINRRY